MNTQRSSESLVRILSGIMWFLMSFELELCLSMTYRVGEFVPSDRAEMEESTLPLEFFLSCWNPKDAGVSRGTQ